MASLPSEDLASRAMSARTRSDRKIEAHHLRETALRRLALGERAQRPPPRNGILAERGFGLEGDERQNAFNLERGGVHGGSRRELRIANSEFAIMPSR